jgi:hypothetical protein
VISKSIAAALLSMVLVLLLPLLLLQCWTYQIPT